MAAQAVRAWLANGYTGGLKVEVSRWLLGSKKMYLVHFESNFHGNTLSPAGQGRAAGQARLRCRQLQQPHCRCVAL